MTAATYDPVNKLIILDQVAPADNLVQYDVQRDLYSDAKEQWKDNDELNKYYFPWSAIGGQELPGGANAPRIFFLLTPWKIRPFEANHDAIFNKNLFTEDGSNLFVPTLGGFTVAPTVNNDFGSGDPKVDQILSMVMELWQIHGLDIDNALTITDVARSVASISQGVADDGTTTTVQRS